jgi:putative toxin-antitoxin system antitoxin component (TIGR02293 family)
MIDVVATAKALGGKKTLGREIKTLLDLRRIVAIGIPPKAAAHLVEQMGGRSRKPLKITDLVASTTLKRRMKENRLSREESERVERIARVFALAVHVLGDNDMVSEFFTTPHAELGGQTPIIAAREELGARQVEEILWGVFYGIPA